MHPTQQHNLPKKNKNQYSNSFASSHLADERSVKRAEVVAGRHDGHAVAAHTLHLLGTVCNVHEYGCNGGALLIQLVALSQA